MNKFALFLSVFLLTSISNLCGQSPYNLLDLQVRKTDESETHKPVGRSPIAIPILYIDENRLLFDTSCDGCTLQLVNEDGDVVYSIVIPDGTETLTLPSDLSGEYELRIIRGQFCFWGYIDL